MEFLKNVFIVIWRGWFFLWSFTTVIILLPILVIVIFKSNWYSISFKIARIWTKTKNSFVFVGKKELGKYPLFGYIYKRTSILVDRNNSQSKIDVFNAAKKCIQNNLSICIFPEGKVPDDESIILDHFQNGTFRLAIENQTPIVPMTFFDCKKRFSYTFLSGSPGELRVKVHNFISTKGSSLTDRNIIKNKIFDVIRNSLLADKSYMESSLTSKTNH